MILDKIFTFLKENKILIQVKNQLLNLIEKNKDKVKKELINIVDEKAPNYENIVVEFILSKIELPIYLKPFKGIVRKTIVKNLDKLVLFIKDEIQNA